MSGADELVWIRSPSGLKAELYGMLSAPEMVPRTNLSMMLRILAHHRVAKDHYFRYYTWSHGPEG